ncbi:hypothetical protein Trco_003740 [Trichoderma cornu-damae]|uniref:Uncharacterized protein n=1 Tax=Trichoderma cornu-damae TaxID=654480 RepID=A0A9P8QRR7_9HYPO|nr:hypothetical protein Trco_003740 [Trichoderma cornu-damae]
MGEGEGGHAAPAHAKAPAPTEEEAKEIQECQKIVQLGDAIISGNHPSIKIPPGLTALSDPASGDARAPSKPNEVDARPQAPEASSASTQAQNPSLPQPPADADAKAADSQHSKPVGAGATEINPILLEKSDELVRAEIQLQRQRLERSLRDEVEQRRVSKQVHAEPAVELDLPDVLAKAQTLVQSTTIPFSAVGGLTANHEAATDSVDDNTFYSSQHETPESNLTSGVRRSTDETVVIDGPTQPQPGPREGTSNNDRLAISTISTTSTTSTKNHPAANLPSRPPFRAHAPAADATPSGGPRDGGPRDGNRFGEGPANDNRWASYANNYPARQMLLPAGDLEMADFEMAIDFETRRMLLLAADIEMATDSGMAQALIIAGRVLRRTTPPKVLPPDPHTELTPQWRMLLPAADLGTADLGTADFEMAADSETAQATIIAGRVMRRITLPKVLFPGPRSGLTLQWRMLLLAADLETADFEMATDSETA